MAKRDILIAPTDDGGWMLNPDGGRYRLHVSGIERDTAERLRQALDRGLSLIREAEGPVLALLRDAPTFRWRELDEYIAQLAMPFRDGLETMQAASPEWQALAEDASTIQRRRRLRETFSVALVNAWGVGYRYAAGLLSEDVDEQLRTTTKLLCLTYSFAHSAAQHEQRRRRLARTIRGWTLHRAPNGCCSVCRSIPDTSPASAPPVVPVHAGCPCSIYPIR